jgi:hypothetical protein
VVGLARVPVRLRQLFKRHGDVRLTMRAYHDDTFSSLAETVKALEKLNLG